MYSCFNYFFFFVKRLDTQVVILRIPHEISMGCTTSHAAGSNALPKPMRSFMLNVLFVAVGCPVAWSDNCVLFALLFF